MVYPPYALTITIFISSNKTRSRARGCVRGIKNGFISSVTIVLHLWRILLTTRNPQWDYDQGTIFGLGTVNNPELFYISVNAKKNSIDQETFAKLESKLLPLVPKINTALKSICHLQITARKPFDTSADIADEDFE